MLNFRVQNNNNIQKAPPRPAKINISDFKKFTPKTIQRQPISAHVIQSWQKKPTPALPVIRQATPALLVRQQLPLIPPIIKPAMKPVEQSLQKRAFVINAPKLKMTILQAPPQPSQAQRVDIQKPISTPIRKQQPTIVRMGSPLIRPAGTGNVSDLKNIGSGRILIMIAAGPSVKEIDFSSIKEHSKIDFMCINKPLEDIWPVKFWAFCDHTQFLRNVSIWDRFEGIVINSANVQARRPRQYIIPSKPGKGFSLDASSGYHIGRSSTYANMQVAFYMNFNKIFICGIDMAAVNNQMHFYGQNPDVSNDRRKERFATEAESYLWAGQNLSQNVKDRFTFCSTYNPWPFMDMFPRLDQKLMIDEVKKLADQLLEEQVHVVQK